jgi:hypothetical protein
MLQALDSISSAEKKKAGSDTRSLNVAMPRILSLLEPSKAQGPFFFNKILKFLSLSLSLSASPPTSPLYLNHFFSFSFFGFVCL